MATKRTKADKAQRLADQLDKKSERRPAQGTFAGLTLLFVALGCQPWPCVY